ncbi:MAG: hypothetical protein KIT84_07680 [Labilithrix sp.]|nr:hypothetical protein [Labilithrix sp.]MCW5810876.1 hypothetical protein [Labilithrix sp.]
MSPCSVERKCSSAGRACAADDRGCQGLAIGDGLEITCERAATESEPVTYVYCPPGGQQRDSSAVWILLFVAVGVAAIGAVVSALVIRRNLRS